MLSFEKRLKKMNLQNKILIQNLKQSEAELKSAKEQSDETYKNFEIAERFLSREVNEFADCKGCRQTITEDDHLVWVGHWYWQSSVYGGCDTEVKYCKHCQVFADELPDACKKCAYSWQYGHLIKSRNEWRKARDLVEQCEEKYQNAKLELKNYRIKRWKDLFSFSWLFDKKNDENQNEFVEEQKTTKPESKTVNVEETQAAELENKTVNVEETQTAELERKLLKRNNSKKVGSTNLKNQIFLIMSQKVR